MDNYADFTSRAETKRYFLVKKAEAVQSGRIMFTCEKCPHAFGIVRAVMDARNAR